MSRRRSSTIANVIGGTLGVGFVGLLTARAQDAGVAVKSGSYKLNNANQAVITQNDRTFTIEFQQYFVENGVLYVDPSVANWLANQGVILGSNLVVPALLSEVAVGLSAIAGGGSALLVGASILDENNEAPVIKQTSFQIDENSTGVVVSLDVEDPDYDNPYFALSGDDASFFVIDPWTGQISLAPGKSLDFDARSDANGDNVYSLIVTMDDKHGNVVVQSIDISLTDQNDNEPVWSGSGTFTVNENLEIPTITLTDLGLSVADLDTVGSLIFSLSGADAAYFDIDVTTGDITFLATADYEAKSVYYFDILVSDGVHSPVAKSVTIDVIDLDEVPPVFADGGTHVVEINENIGANQTVYTPLVSDNFAVVRFEISGVDAGQFDFEPSNGAMSLITNPDHESTDSYSITVTAFDAAGNSAIQELTLSILDVNDSPSSADKNVTIDEDTTYVFSAADFEFSDVDDGASLSGIRIVTLPGNGDLLFDGIAVSINSLISVSDVPKLTYKPNINGFGTAYDGFEFRVSDGGLDSQVANKITFDVTDTPDLVLTNRDPIRIIVSDNTSSEALTSNPNPDGLTNTYSITGTNADLFQVSTSGDLSWKDGNAPSFASIGDTAFDITLHAEHFGETAAQEITILYSTDDLHIGGLTDDHVIGGDQNEALVGGGESVLLANHSGQNGNSDWATAGQASIEETNPSDVADGDNDDQNFFIVETAASSGNTLNGKLTQTLGDTYDSQKTYHIVFDEVARNGFGNASMQVTLSAGGTTVLTKSVDLGPNDSVWRIGYIVGGSGFSDANGQNLEVSFEAKKGFESIFDNVRIFATDETSSNGDDILFGNDGNDFLNGGKGNDELIGGAGNDLFAFGDDFGQDVIVDFDAVSEIEQIDFTASSIFREFSDIQSRISASSTSNAVILDNGAGNTITLNGVELGQIDATDFRFATSDVGSITAAGNGTTIDILNHSFEDDLLVTGASAAPSNWTTTSTSNFALNPVYRDVENGPAPDGPNVLRIANGTVSQSVGVEYNSNNDYFFFYDLMPTSSSGFTKIIKSGLEAGDTSIVLDTHNNRAVDSWYTVSARSTVHDSALDGEIIKLLFTGVTQSTYVDNVRLVSVDRTNLTDQIIVGDTQNDTLVSGYGNDTLTGNVGSDLFYFFEGMGQDIITDFNPSQDNEFIDISSMAYSNFNDLLANAITQNGSEVIIDFGTGDTITLQDLDVSDLSASDFIFGDGAPIFTRGLNLAVSIDEKVGAGRVVHTPEVLGNIQSYSLGGADQSAFSIDPDTGVVTLIDNPDFSTQNRYDFTVAATDTNGNTETQSVVLDVNDVVVSLWPQSVTFVENTSPGTEITVLVGGSENGTLAAQPYEIVGGTGAGLFVLDSVSGSLSTAAGAEFDHEGTNQYSLDVKITDQAGSSLTRTVDISIDNANTSNSIGASSSFNFAKLWNLAESALPSDYQNSLNSFAITQKVDWLDNGVIGDSDFAVIFTDNDGTPSITAASGVMHGLIFYFDTWEQLKSGDYQTFAERRHPLVLENITNLGVLGNNLYFDNVGYGVQYGFNPNSGHDFAWVNTNSDHIMVEDFGTSFVGANAIKSDGLYRMENTSSAVRLDSTILYDRENLYDFADIDYDGDIEVFEYNKSSDTLKIYHQTDTTGLNQYDLMSGTWFDGKSLSSLSMGSSSATGTDLVQLFEFIDVDEDGDLELVLANLGETHVYDEVWI